MAKRGPKPKELNKKEFDKLCEMQCTLEEIAGWFGVDENTVQAWVEREYGVKFSVIFGLKKAGGNVSLRRKQRQEALKGNTALLIWLGKQQLGQSDKQELDVKKPMIIKIDGDDKDL